MFSSQDFELVFGVGSRVRISSQGLLTIYKKFPENQSVWKVNGTRLFGLFQRKVSGSNVPNSGGKMKWFRLESFKKHGLWLEAIYFFTTLVCKLIGYTLYIQSKSFSPLTTSNFKVLFVQKIFTRVVCVNLKHLSFRPSWPFSAKCKLFVLMANAQKTGKRDKQIKCIAET